MSSGRRGGVNVKGVKSFWILARRSGSRAGKGGQEGFFSVPALFTSEIQPPVTVRGTPEWPASLLHLVDGKMNQSEAVSSLVCIQDSLPCSRAVGTSALMNLSSRIIDTEDFWQRGASLEHNSERTHKTPCRAMTAPPTWTVALTLLLFSPP